MHFQPFCNLVESSAQTWINETRADLPVNGGNVITPVVK
jgi:hypothetical protein